MGYWVGTTGEVRLPEQDEQRAHAFLRARMLAVQDGGWLRDDEPTESLEDLASFAAAQFTRRGDVLVFAPDEAEDNKWSAQATAFWTGMGELVTEGRVDMEGEDGCTWSYEFTPTGLVQRGTNGWDGTGTDEPAPQQSDPFQLRGAPEQELARRTPEQAATRRARSRRYLVFGAIPAAAGAGLLATGNGGGIALAIGTVNLLIGWRLSRPH